MPQETEKLEWFKYNSNFSSNVKIFGSRLLIDSIQSNDDLGIYVCSADFGSYSMDAKIELNEHLLFETNQIVSDSKRLKIEISQWPIEIDNENKIELTCGLGKYSKICI